MIIDHDTDFLYLPDRLQEMRYKDFYHPFVQLLHDNNIPFDILESTSDIWCRDYMPVQVRKDRFIQFQYDPDYLDGRDDLKTNGKAVAKSIGIEIIPSNINLDGGNVVKVDNKVILTDKIFKENQDFAPNDLIQELKLLFETENLIIIPKLPYDDIGHSDGMVRFLDETTVLVNDYSNTEQSKSWQEKFKKSLAEYNIGTIEIPYIEVTTKNDEGICPAIGCYINYLQVGDLIFLPQFGIAEDQLAEKQFKDIFKGKTVIPVNCNSIAERGGVLNCISWNIKAQVPQ